MSKIYVASSWRNPYQPSVVQALRTGTLVVEPPNSGQEYPTAIDLLDGVHKVGYKHEVYDFRNPGDPWNSPTTGDDEGGFQWSSIDPWWQDWTPWAFKQALESSEAYKGYGADLLAMEKADMCVLLLPSGASAHLEAGYFAGHPDKSLHILLMQSDLGVRREHSVRSWEPELMYKLADGIWLSLEDLMRNIT